MALLETIKENIETAGQITAELAKRTAETIRLRDQIRRDNKEIRKLTYEIGQTYLRLHEEDYEDIYKDFIDGIKAARDDIADKEVQLAALREKPEVSEEGDIMAADEEEWDDLFEEVSEAEGAGEEADAEKAAESTIEIVEAQREPEETAGETVKDETAAETATEEAEAEAAREDTETKTVEE